MLFMLLGWSSVPVTYLMVPVMEFGGEDFVCPLVEGDDSCCSCALLPPTFGLSEVDVLVVFFHHVFNGLGSLSNLNLTTPMANTVYIWHH